MEILSDFEFNIKHIKGKENNVVYTLNIKVNPLMEISISSIKI